MAALIYRFGWAVQRACFAIAKRVGVEAVRREQARLKDRGLI